MGCIPGKLGLCSRKKGKSLDGKKKKEEPEEAENEGGRRTFKPSQGLRAIIPIIQSASLLAQATISTSQSNFFKMLDERIEAGHEMDSEEEKEEQEAQMRRVVEKWKNFLATKPTPEQMYHSCHLASPATPSPSPQTIAKGRVNQLISRHKIDRNFSTDSLDGCCSQSESGGKLFPQREDEGNTSDDSAISLKVEDSNTEKTPSQEEASDPIHDDSAIHLSDNTDSSELGSAGPREDPQTPIVVPKVVITSDDAEQASTVSNMGDGSVDTGDKVGDQSGSCEPVPSVAEGVVSSTEKAASSAEDSVASADDHAASSPGEKAEKNTSRQIESVKGATEDLKSVTVDKQNAVNNQQVPNSGKANDNDSYSKKNTVNGETGIELAKSDSALNSRQDFRKGRPLKKNALVDKRDFGSFPVTAAAKLRRVLRETRSSDSLPDKIIRSNGVKPNRSSDSLPDRPNGDVVQGNNSPAKIQIGKPRRSAKRRKSYPPPSVVIFGGKPTRTNKAGKGAIMTNGTVITRNRLTSSSSSLYAGRSPPGSVITFEETFPVHVK